MLNQDNKNAKADKEVLIPRLMAHTGRAHSQVCVDVRRAGTLETLDKAIRKMCCDQYQTVSFFPGRFVMAWCNNEGMCGLKKNVNRKTDPHLWRGTPVMSSEAVDSAAYCAGTLKQARRMACVIGSQDGALWGIDQSDEWTRLADNLVGETLLHSGALILNYVHRLRDVELQYPKTDWLHLGDSSKAGEEVDALFKAQHLVEGKPVEPIVNQAVGLLKE
jgi:hypothetical protein